MSLPRKHYTSGPSLLYRQQKMSIREQRRNKNLRRRKRSRALLFFILSVSVVNARGRKHEVSHHSRKINQWQQQGRRKGGLLKGGSSLALQNLARRRRTTAVNPKANEDSPNRPLDNVLLRPFVGAFQLGRRLAFSRRESTITTANSTSIEASSTATSVAAPTHNPLNMYLNCMGIVLLWVTTGTLFYSFCNDWPLPQSFFYAIDAGMSIGFCTDVHETKLVSKAFTILYILLGASVVGGALTLFLQDALEDIAHPSVQEYQLLLDQHVFDKADLDRTGVLNYDEFCRLLQSTLINGSKGTPKGDPMVLTDEDLQLLWQKFDRLQDGVIHFEEFTGAFHGIESLIRSVKRQQKKLKRSPEGWWSRWWSSSLPRRVSKGMLHLVQSAWRLENRIFVVFLLWISMGIIWGMLDQGWDPITATHFAVSALATGGLTAPSVNQDGILPADPAIFCGVFCLLGIPLMALALGHFALYLVSHHVASLEREALTRPMTAIEFQVAANLATRDHLVHLSDFIVLQLLRQGKISLGTIDVLTKNFDRLDTEGKRALTLEQATSPPQ